MSSQPRFPWIWLGVIVSISIGIAWYAAFLNNYAITPDFSGLACAANHLATEGEFIQYTSKPFAFEMCWQPHRYVALQLLHAGILTVLPITISTLLLFTIGGAYVGLIIIMAVVSWRITESQLATASTALLTATCPAVIRSLVLTPQNLFGYAMIAGVILMTTYLLLAEQRNSTRRIPLWPLWLVGLFGLIMAIGFTHDLSFGIVSIAFGSWVGLIFMDRWWKKLLTFGFGGLLIWLDLTTGALPVSVKGAWFLLTNSQLNGFYHPLWDHPAIWGYLITGLGMLGLVIFKQYVQSQYHKILWLLIFIAAVAVVFGHLPLIGVELLPNRFVPFAWMPLVLAAGIGVQALWQTVGLPRWLVAGCIGLIFSAQLVHGIVFMHDDINGLSFRYRPSDGFVESVEWLQKNDPEAHLLGIQSATDQAILVAPQWFFGEISYYPWFALNHRKIKKFNVVNPSSPFSDIINQPEHPQYIRLFEMYTIVTKRNSPEATAAIAKHQYDYLLVNKKAQPYTELWSKNTPEQYPVAYENTEYILYEL